MRKIKLKIAIPVLIVMLLIISPFTLRAWIHKSSQSRIYTNISRVPHCKVALVLGAKVHKSGVLSSFLRDRVNKAIELYKAGKADKLLMSSDNRFTHYNEPQHMFDYAIKRGVPAKDISMDFAGRRTYDSIYRAKHIFGQTKIIIVSQSFHLDRAIFLSKRIGVDAYGVSSDVENLHDKRAEIRELPASVSAFLDAYIFSPKPVMGRKENI